MRPQKLAHDARVSRYLSLTNGAENISKREDVIIEQAMGQLVEQSATKQTRCRPCLLIKPDAQSSPSNDVECEVRCESFELEHGTPGVVVLTCLRKEDVAEDHDLFQNGRQHGADVLGAKDGAQSGPPSLLLSRCGYHCVIMFKLLLSF